MDYGTFPTPDISRKLPAKSTKDGPNSGEFPVKIGDESKHFALSRNAMRVRRELKLRHFGEVEIAILVAVTSKKTTGLLFASGHQNSVVDILEHRGSLTPDLFSYAIKGLRFALNWQKSCPAE
jgi:hypothetical protein